MSSETLQYHHGKHVQAYVDNLNRLVAGTEFENEPLQVISVTAEGALYNNAAQVLNHNIFFSTLAPVATAKKAPTGELLTFINRDFGSFDNFKKEFGDKAKAHFGSGWTWLAIDNDDKLHILSMTNAENPLKMGYRPVMGMDVWEHSYYIDYRNNRGQYVDRLWDILDWKMIEMYFADMRDAVGL